MHVTRYDEFPDIDLYMDQVITYLNKQLGNFSKEEGDIVTPSMINNYVKHGLIPPPTCKKYNRRHLAYMTAVFFLKQVLKMDEIKAVIDHHVALSDERNAYEMFCSRLEDALETILPIEADSAEEAGNLTLKYAAVAIAGKMYAQKTVASLKSLTKTQKPNQKDKEKKEQKKKEEPQKQDKEWKEKKLG